MSLPRRHGMEGRGLTASPPRIFRSGGGKCFSSEGGRASGHWLPALGWAVSRQRGRRGTKNRWCLSRSQNSWNGSLARVARRACSCRPCYPDSSSLAGARHGEAGPMREKGTPEMRRGGRRVLGVEKAGSKLENHWDRDSAMHPLHGRLVAAKWPTSKS
ncbi:hypothetical protein GQ53DRAFT_316954 [Thozetella sp. PMI_491]|nr:hypothetical protein GQ53DRAFT_316954 [Thozetella sp. PMI_491]